MLSTGTPAAANRSTTLPSMPQCAVGQALRCGACVPGSHQVPGDIDTQHVRSKPRRRQGRRAVAAAQVQQLVPVDASEAPDECVTAFPHALGDAREVAFLPQRLVRVH